MLEKDYFFSVTFILSSANALSLDQSSILSFGKEQKASFLRVVKRWDCVIIGYANIISFFSCVVFFFRFFYNFFFVQILKTLGKGDIAPLPTVFSTLLENLPPFSPFSTMFSTQSDNCLPFVHIFDIIFLFAAELEEPKIGI